MPLRSVGCYECRRRKIRCDAVRPQCLKCTLRGDTCPGFKIRKIGDVEFRYETGRTAGRVEGGSKVPSVVVATTDDNDSQEKDHRACVAPPLSVLRSPAANRVQLYSAFLDAWIPHNILPSQKGCSFEIVQFDVFRRIASIAPDNSALCTAMDALSLISTANIKADAQLKPKAVEKYSEALHRTSRALGQPNVLQDDNTLAAVLVLHTCEFYDDIRESGGQSFTSHLQGLQALIEKRGPTNHGTPWPFMLLAHACLSNWSWSMLKRKKNFLEAPRWQGMKLPMDCYTWGFDPTIKLPGLLQRHDELLEEANPELADINDVLLELYSIAQILDEALSPVLPLNPTESTRQFVSEPIETFSPFSTLVTDRTLTQGYQFTGYIAAFMHNSYWIRMYYIQDTIQSLLALRGKLYPKSGPADDDPYSSDAEEALLTYALHLCRSIPFFTQSCNSAIGDMLCFHGIVIATRHFYHSQSWGWLQWLQNVRENVFVRGLSLPVVTDAVPLWPGWRQKFPPGFETPEGSGISAKAGSSVGEMGSQADFDGTSSQQ